MHIEKSREFGIDSIVWDVYDRMSFSSPSHNDHRLNMWQWAPQTKIW